MAVNPEVARLKKKVNRIVKQRDALKDQIEEVRSELRDAEQKLADQPDLDVDLMEEAMVLLRSEHDQYHHWGSCASCRALAILESQLNVNGATFTWNKEGWEKDNAVTR